MGCSDNTWVHHLATVVIVELKIHQTTLTCASICFEHIDDEIDVLDGLICLSSTALVRVCKSVFQSTGAMYCAL